MKSSEAISGEQWKVGDLFSIRPLAESPSKRQKGFDAIASQTTFGRLLRMENIDSGRAAKAILSVLPLDSFVKKPAERMEVVGKPKELLPVHKEVQREIDAAEGKSWPMGSIERFAFYERAKKAYCVIQSGEQRGYGCFVFKKGVIIAPAG